MTRAGVGRPKLRAGQARYWMWVAVTAAVITVMAGGTLLALGYTVRPLELILLGSAGALALAVFMATLGPAQLPSAGRDLTDPWHVQHAVPYAAPGRDLRVVLDARAITAELGGRRPNPDLHQRLRELAEARLRAAGAGALTDPQSAEGLGERAFGLLTGAPRRLTPDDLTHVIDRIEEL